MISLHISIANPWAKYNFSNLFNRSGILSKHKAWEFEVYRHAYDILKMTFTWSARTDHAGPSITLGLFGYVAQLQIYDTRHWDDKRGCWEE